MTIDDLAELELCYAPPFGSAKDPLNLAGMAAQNVVNGLVTLVQWHEIPALLASQDHIVVDVREVAERDGGVIPGSIPIPLGQLRGRLGELPTDKILLVHCASGLRSYNACRMLTQHGFKCRNLTGSYKTWATANT
jgi:rhodanese-related sulfurtransferase